jgi:hypothetical protein
MIFVWTCPWRAEALCNELPVSPWLGSLWKCPLELGFRVWFPSHIISCSGSFIVVCVCVCVICGLQQCCVGNSSFKKMTLSPSFWNFKMNKLMILSKFRIKQPLFWLFHKLKEPPVSCKNSQRTAGFREFLLLFFIFLKMAIIYQTWFSDLLKIVIKKLKNHPHNRWGFCAIFDSRTTQVESGLKSGPNFVTSIQTTYYPRLLAPFFPVTSPSQRFNFWRTFCHFFCVDVVVDVVYRFTLYTWYQQWYQRPDWPGLRFCDIGTGIIIALVG